MTSEHKLWVIVVVAFLLALAFGRWIENAYPQTLRTFTPHCQSFTWDANPELDVNKYCIEYRRPWGPWQKGGCVTDRLTTTMTCEQAKVTVIDAWEACLKAVNAHGMESRCSESLHWINYPKVGVVAGGPSIPPTVALEITEVTVFAPGFEQACRVGLHEFRLKSFVYTDRSFKVTALPFRLNGASYLQLANDLKGSQASPLLAFTVNQEVEVCIGRDTRLNDAPAWMDGFTQGSVEIIETTDARFEVACQTFPAGVVTLGHNQDAPVKIQSSMYVVVIKEGT